MHVRDGMSLHHLDSAAMDRRLARRNLRTALITAVIGLLMFALTFVAALLYVA
jgi:predicted secreted protein